MKYMGSKNRIANHILPIMLKYRTPEMTWVEPFVGGANMIDKVEGNRIGADFNKYIAEMWKQLEAGWMPRKDYTKDDYYDVKNNMERNLAETGYLGIAVSYCGKWWGGYAGLCDTKSMGLVDYQKQAYNNLLKQLPNIKGIEFVHSSYDELQIHQIVLFIATHLTREQQNIKMSLTIQNFGNGAEINQTKDISFL